MPYYKMAKTYTAAQKKAYAKRMKNKKNKPPVTGQKKAMNYKQRSNFAANRSAIVETKKITSGVSTTHLSNLVASNPTFLPPISFLKYQQGIGEQYIIGQSIYSKYYSMKMKFDFPSGVNTIKENYKIQVIHGWMTAPFALDSTFSPLKNEPTTAQLEAIMVARLRPNWNSATDQLLFNDKEKAILRIEGKQWIQPDLRHQIGLNAQYHTALASQPQTIAGGLPSVSKQLTWKPMRKIKLEYSSDGGTTSGSGVSAADPYYYPNQSWIPFVCVYTPQFANAGSTTDGQVLVSQSDCHWFSDS